MKGRIILSAIFVASVALFNAFTTPITTVISGHLAGNQFVNSDALYVVSNWGQSLLSMQAPLSAALVILGLALLWVGPTYRGLVALSNME